MHMADALVSPAVATTMYIASGAVGAYSLNKIKKEKDNPREFLSDKYIIYYRIFIISI